MIFPSRDRVGRRVYEKQRHTHPDLIDALEAAGHSLTYTTEWSDRGTGGWVNSMRCIRCGAVRTPRRSRRKQHLSPERPCDS
jgi:hypothetical protein